MKELVVEEKADVPILDVIILKEYDQKTIDSYLEGIIDEEGKIEEVIGKVDTKNHAAQILKNGISSTRVIAEKITPAKRPSAKVGKKTAKKSSASSSAKKRSTVIVKKSAKKKK